MGVITSSRWGSVEKPKSKMTGAELKRFYIGHSHMDIKCAGSKEGLEMVHIELHGEIARIPSLKNWKLPGQNFTNPDVTARIRAMDHLFQKTYLPDLVSVAFGDSEVHMTLVCGERTRNFDLVGCVETIQDWLEPSSKKVGRKGDRRGWGVGLINNDSQVTPMPLHSWQTGIRHEHSIIILRRWKRMQEPVLNCLAAAYLLNRVSSNDGGKL